MSNPPSALGDIVDFLHAHPPFDARAVAEVERVVTSAEVEFFPAGATIFAEAQPSEHLRVVRAGAVEIVLDERVLDELGPGEPFGHASMLSGLPPGFAARARKDTLCYRIPDELARSMLTQAESVAERAGAQLAQGGVLAPGGIGAEADVDRARPPGRVSILRRPRGAVAAAYKRARLPRGRTPWHQASFCAVDLELTGLDPKRDEIVSFGAIPIEHGCVQLGAAVHGRVRPLGEISEAAIRVHGIRAADLAGAPPLDVAIDPLLAVMAGRVPVVHVAAIERGFLRPALRRQGVRLRGPMIDTSVLGLLWLHVRDGHGPRRMSLGDLVDALGLPSHHPHDALGDALTTAQAFVALATHLHARRQETVRSLAAADRRLELLGS